MPLRYEASMAGIRVIMSIVAFSTLQLMFLDRFRSLCWGRKVEETPQKSIEECYAAQQFQGQPDRNCRW